ncbi:FkbM family methyltransferase [Leptospira noguchii]|nr:FkbM family methyltransferase [Leptospira noguchii]EMS86764.1 methyltransferase FkbM domain protein [Leptospira noguchii str. Hook]UOG28983.1 FkbM family methyltransferase [Leptospira noguchii]UOG32838.1 FkbM family methyltransferase [Leptospira noguchii]UOG43639.1 FkbM family methyltransferase [Leptospira noguchii]
MYYGKLGSIKMTELLKSLIRKFKILIKPNKIIKKVINLGLNSSFKSISIKTKEGKIKFFDFGSIAIWKAQTLLIQEPETIEWIETFLNNSVFWDIGTNIGGYSIYAGNSNKNLKILAFEPSAVNFFLLNRNIFLNEMDQIISAYPIAFSDFNSLGYLHMNSDIPGGTMNIFSEKDIIKEAKIGGNFIQINCKQAMISYTIDSFIDLYKPPLPNYIKIDVDNFGDKIIKGGAKILNSPKLKSVSIKLNDNEIDYVNRVITIMQKASFYKFEKYQHETIFHKGSYSSFYNYIFYKK